MGAVAIVERVVLRVYLAVLKVDDCVTNSLQLDVGIASSSVTSTDQCFFAPVGFLDIIFRPFLEGFDVWLKLFLFAMRSVQEDMLHLLVHETPVQCRFCCDLLCLKQNSFRVFFIAFLIEYWELYTSPYDLFFFPALKLWLCRHTQDARDRWEQTHLACVRNRGVALVAVLSYDNVGGLAFLCIPMSRLVRLDQTGLARLFLG